MSDGVREALEMKAWEIVHAFRNEDALVPYGLTPREEGRLVRRIAAALATPERAVGEPALYADDGNGRCRTCSKLFGSHIIRETPEYPRGVACCPIPPLPDDAAVRTQLAAAREEVEKLRDIVAELENEDEAERVAHFKAHWRDATEALRVYGRHLAECRVVYPTTASGDVCSCGCSCGFDAALARLTGVEGGG